MSDVIRRDFWAGRRVFVTGHTGFKGSWLTFWLTELGAVVCGYALAPATSPDLFSVLGLAERCRHHTGDVRDADTMAKTLVDFAPEVVFHLAAQPIVLEGYREPVGTMATNVMGTVNLLQSLRTQESVRSCVVVTSDKCYENREWLWGYRERDPLGGQDIYSASKACQEIVTNAFRASFFGEAKAGGEQARVATARAGNVIGGGDWAEHRLVPDMMRSFAKGESVAIRRPDSQRPWQHVIDPLRGYLLLAQRLCDSDGGDHRCAYNFGPADADALPVRALADRFCESWGDEASWDDQSTPDAPHEAGLLKLDTSLARARLGWRPRIDFDTCVEATVRWYKTFYRGGSDLGDLTAQQLEELGGAA